MFTKAKIFALVAPVGLAIAATAALPDSERVPAPAVVIPAEQQAPARQKPAAATVRYVVAPTGNEARYRVREQLVGRDLPNDAVGATSEITGAIFVGTDGKLVPAQSKVIVSTAKFASDSERRDGYVRRRLFETEQFPTVELVPTGIRGISGRPPTSGTRTFQLLGNLTVRGVTRPTVWNVRARFQGDQVTGTAATRFTFNDFNLTQPRVPVVLSVADTIRLEYDFNLTREGQATR